MLENIGGGELLIIIIIIFLFWGPTKLPEIGKYLGKSIFEFRKAMREVQDNLNLPSEDLKNLKENFNISQKIENIQKDITNELIKDNKTVEK
jgi:TatA/E family protein of Tat protein translocase